MSQQQLNSSLNSKRSFSDIIPLDEDLMAVDEYYQESNNSNGQQQQSSLANSIYSTQPVKNITDPGAKKTKTTEKVTFYYGYDGQRDAFEVDVSEENLKYAPNNEHLRLLMDFRNLGFGEDFSLTNEEIMKQNEENSDKQKLLVKYSQTHAQDQVIKSQCIKLRELQLQLYALYPSRQKYETFDSSPEDVKEEIVNLLYKTQRDVLLKTHNPNGKRHDSYFFPILAQKNLFMVDELMNKKNNLNAKISKDSDINIQQLQTLKGYMTDVVLNEYLDIMVKGIKNPLKYFNSYLFQFLSQPKIDWKKIIRIVNKKDIKIKEDTFYIPMNLENAHWAFCEVNCNLQKITFYDSMITSFKSLNKDNLQEFLKKKMSPVIEMVAKIQEAQNAQQINFDLKLGHTAIQTSGKCCGIFVLVAIHYKMLGYQITFTQDDLEYLQRKMAIELIQQKLI